MSQDELNFNSSGQKPKKSRNEQIVAAFEKFCAANPKLWELFVRFSFEAINSQRDTYSSNAIFERIRWHVDITVNTAGELKLNNNFRAYYARLFHYAYPQHDGFFRIRYLTSKDRRAAKEDLQEFVGPPAEAEPLLKERLMLLLKSLPKPPVPPGP